MGVMHHLDVAVHFFFGIEGLPAVWAHVLSRSGLRGAFAFSQLTHGLFTSRITKKRKKPHKPLCARYYATHLCIVQIVLAALGQAF